RRDAGEGGRIRQEDAARAAGAAGRNRSSVRVLRVGCGLEFHHWRGVACARWRNNLGCWSCGAGLSGPPNAARRRNAFTFSDRSIAERLIALFRISIVLS